MNMQRHRYGDIDYAEEPDMPEDLQIILSTTCNLKCRTCNPITVANG